MIWDKGIGEFVEAARTLRQEHHQARFVLVGRLDPEHPSAISSRQIEKWALEGIVEWWGEQENMPKVLSQASVVVLPSVREGVPQVLMEAAASAKPIVATDIPGCQDVVKNGVNGFLVSVGDSNQLAQAIRKLLVNSQLRISFGQAGRKIAEKEFSQEAAVKKTLKVYEEALAKKRNHK
jgi:glycosyltransferase involved in cell wall biosynthesis